MGSVAVNVGPADASSGRYLNWNDEALLVNEDHRRRLYRRLQSWYRQERLDAPYGWTKPRAATTQRPAVPARPVGSLLDQEWGNEHPAANFLAPSEYAELILAYVNTRQNDVLKSGGSLDPVRLRTNMLSSMPMCFNLFAPLRAQPAAALDLLRRGFGVDAVELIQVADIDGIECEWAPPPGAGIGDRTAFDAVVAYRDGLGQRCLLGVETKYTETFSPTEYGRPGDERQASRRAHYLRWTQAGWFRAGAEDRLYARATNQLWRNVMLAAACEELPDVDRADVAVVGLHGDPHAFAALRGVRGELLHPDRLRDASLERIVQLTAAGELGEWSSAFKQRYTDVSAVAEGDAFATSKAGG